MGAYLYFATESLYLFNRNIPLWHEDFGAQRRRSQSQSQRQRHTDDRAAGHWQEMNSAEH